MKRKVLRPVSVIVTTILLFQISIAQNTPKKAYSYKEERDDPYMPMPESEKKTSPAYRYSGSVITTIQINVDENGENILNDAANEPSIGIDPNDPDRMVIGWRQFDNVNSNFRQAGYSYSEDGGLTWSLPGVIQPGVFRSDPVIDANNDGEFFFNSLNISSDDDYWCEVFKTSPGDFSWGNSTFAQGGDKQWMHIDKNNGPGEGHVYAVWSPYYNICDPSGAFTRSTVNGESYEECLDIPGNPFRGGVTTDHNSDLYAVGEHNDKLIMAKSTSAKFSDQAVSWDMTSFVDLDGKITIWPAINPAGLLGQAWIDTDKSFGPGRGNIYVLASVERYGGDPGDVMFTRSTDGGETWESPIRINDDDYSNKFQWFGAISVSPNGRIDVTWLDNRNASILFDEYASELFYSYSLDNGQTWSENEKLSWYFDPHDGWPNQNKIGDYMHQISDDEGVHLAWSNTLNGEQDVYYSRIIPTFVGLEERKEQNISFVNYPNPVQSKTTLRYQLVNSTDISITLFDILGNQVDIVFNGWQDKGTHNLVYDTGWLPAGVYFCKIESGTVSETIKITVID